MATKKVPVEEVPVETAEQETQAEEPKAEEPKVMVCGHVNRQHYNSKGRLSEILCDLPPKHTGDHHAKYMKNVGEPVNDEKGRVTRVTYHEEEADTYWNDAAAKPVGDVVVGTVEALNLNQKDMIMAVLNNDPTLSTEAALNIAKAKAEWNLQEPS